jgi:hypothetical protein
MNLTIELVPKTAWYTNVRSNCTRTEWDVIRKKSYAKAGNKCEICGDVGQKQGFKHAVECHEVWEYNDVAKTQTLIGFISLCPRCHQVKHPGLAQINGQIEFVITQLMKINGMTRTGAISYLDASTHIWRERSKYQWKLDISYVQEYLKQ